MVFGLMTSPLRMIFSLLVMQGISLTMFRAFLNQAIQRYDPLKFQLNLGNTNFSSGPSSPTSAPSVSIQSPLHWATATLLGSQLTTPPPPTPAPLVDQRVLDLMHLIRAMQQTNSPAGTITSVGSSPSNNQPPTLQLTLPAPSVQTTPQIMSAPIIALNPISQSTTPSPPPIIQVPISSNVPSSNGQSPQIIILPTQMKTSASNQRKRKVRPPPKKPEWDHENNDDEPSKTTTTASSIDKNLLQDEPNDNDVDGSMQMVMKIKNNKRKKYRKKHQKERESPSANDLIVFDAVGWTGIGGDDEN